MPQPNNVQSQFSSSVSAQRNDLQGPGVGAGHLYQPWRKSEVIRKLKSTRDPPVYTYLGNENWDLRWVSQVLKSPVAALEQIPFLGLLLRYHSVIFNRSPEKIHRRHYLPVSERARSTSRMETSRLRGVTAKRLFFLEGLYCPIHITAPSTHLV